jgi:hypothetical protein
VNANPDPIMMRPLFTANADSSRIGWMLSVHAVVLKTGVELEHRVGDYDILTCSFSSLYDLTIVGHVVSQ